jgi:putative inorganic carbon (hco3(-)) transporter
MLSPSQPYFYLLAYIVVQFIRPHEYIPAFVGAPIVPVLLVFVSLFWLVAQKKSFEAPQHRVLLGLLAAIFISVALTGWIGGAVSAAAEFVPTMILFYLVATSVDSIKRFKEMCLVLIGVCCVMALHGVEQAASEDGVGWTGAKLSDGRITYLGFLNDPNDLAMAFVMILPLTMYLAAASRSFILRHAYHGAAALILYGVYLCNSRGSLLAIGAMLFAYAVHRFGWVRSLVVAPMLALPLALLAPSRVSDMSADEESAAGRVEAWYEGFQMLRNNPIFGVGKGLFVDHHELTAHNSFVLAFAEIGVVGYFFWLSLIVLSALMLLQLLRPQGNHLPPAAASVPGGADEVQQDWSEWQKMARALMYAFVGTLVAAFFLSRTYSPVIYLVIALIVAAHQGVRSRWPSFSTMTVREHRGLLLKIEGGSIVGLWLLTRVLLTTS